MNPIKNVDDFIKKVQESKTKDKFDLSSDEDLSIAVMNVVRIDEHFLLLKKHKIPNIWIYLMKCVRCAKNF